MCCLAWARPNNTRSITASFSASSDCSIRMKNRTLNIAVIGCGRIGRIHAENLATRIPGARLAAVADIVGACAQEVADQFHVPKATGDYHELLADPAIE